VVSRAFHIVCGKWIPSGMMDFNFTAFVNTLWFTEQILCLNDFCFKPMNLGQIFYGSLC